MATVVCFSGGLDSTVLLYYLKYRRNHVVRALSVDYGQRHRKELDAARDITGLLEVPHFVADLSGLRPILSGSSQTDDAVPVPEGHYAEESMKATVVPNRNMLLLSVAGMWAVSSKSKFVAYAAHAGDHAIYPDCRGEFSAAMTAALALCDWEAISLITPFLSKTKASIVHQGYELGVPFARTWSCYKGGEKHCGKCGTCVERREAFKDAGVIDPTEYE